MGRIINTRFPVSVVVLAVFAMNSLSYAVYYHFTTLDSMASPESINNQGQIVGFSGAHAGAIYASGTATPLGLTPLLGSLIINNAGQILASTTHYDARLYSNGEWQALGSLPGGYLNNTCGIDLNDAGQVIGTDDTIYFPGDVVHYASFLYEDGAMIDLWGFPGITYGTAVAINNAGQILFNTRFNPQHGAAILNPDGSVVMLALKTAIDINDLGQVVGTAIFGNGQTHAALWEDGQLRDLGTLDGVGSYPTTLNNAGQIIGRSGDQSFLYTAGTMYDLSMVTDADMSGWTRQSLYPTDINDSGVIVGGYTPAFHIGGGFVLNPVVPEPCTLMLLTTGCLIAARRAV